MLKPHHGTQLSPDVLAFIRTIGSLSVLLIPLIWYSPPLKPIRNLLNPLLADLVPIDTLVPSTSPTVSERAKADRGSLKLWRQVLLVTLAIIEAAAWMAVVGVQALAFKRHEVKVVDLILASGMVLLWLYLFALPLVRPPNTPPWSIAIVYLLLWTISVTSLALAGYTRTATGAYPLWASTIRIVAEAANVLVTTILLTVIGGLRLTSPNTLARLSSVAPDDVVSLWQWLTFTWVNPFITLGNTKELNEEDLPPMSLTVQTAITFERFQQVKANSLLKQLLIAHRLDLVLDATLTLVSVVFNYAGPFFLKRILDGLTDRSPEAMSKAYTYAFLAFLASVLKAVSDLFHLWHSRRSSIRIKAELTAAIYDKALRRKDASGVVAEKEDENAKPGEEKKEKKVNADSGKIVNLMASDTNRISNTVSGAYYIYGAPFEIVVASIFLYKILGWSAFAGIVVIAVAAPLNSYVSKRSIKITQGLLKARDKRIGVMNELIGAIQFIKFFAWTEQWKSRAAEARAKEMKELIRSFINSIWFALLWNLAPIFVTLISFFCFIVIEKRDLTVSIAFTAISLFTMVRMPLNVIPTYIVILLQSQVSVKRIQDFLAEDEVPDWVSSLKRQASSDDEPTKIGFEKATLRWNSGKQPAEPKKDVASTSLTSSTSTGESTVVDDTPIFSLSDLNVDFPLGKLSVITGPTGSGKTAILTALLGEMELVSGKSHLPKKTTRVDETTGLRDSIAYCAQTPWLQQRSIKDNILFGDGFDEKRYEETLEACALVPDLEMLEDGDMTEIGAKGVSLSGGQKARVALARAVYSYTRHLLLDDPLAAVDSHTAKHLTDKCLNGSLLKDRTIILVSHHVELLLPSADYLIRVVDGRIDAQGTPDELRAAGELDGLVALEDTEVKKDEPVVNSEAVEGEVMAAEKTESEEAEKKKEKKKGPGKKLVQDEERAVGNVKWATYKLYIVAATYTTWAFTLVILLLMQLASVGERYWLKLWGEAYTTQVRALSSLIKPLSFGMTPEHHHLDVTQHFLHYTDLPVEGNSTMSALTSPLSNLPSADLHPGYYLVGYAIIVIGASLLGCISSAVGSWGQYKAAVNLHDRLLDTILHSTIRFFNVTPLGRIINRFSRDIETVDTSLSSTLRTVITYVASLVGAVAVVAIIVPWFLIPAVAISYLYYQYSVLYLRVGRSLRRLEATLKSPIFSGFAELLDGVISVRAFSVEARFMKQLCERVDKTHSAFYYYWMMNRWLLLRFDVLGAFATFFTTLFALSGAVKAGSAGMAILSAQSFVTACYWVSRFWGQLEMDFNAVERVQEYLQVPQEPASSITNRTPPAYWPSTGSGGGEGFLSVRDLEIKYAPDLPTVFKGSFDVKAGEKIGLIGRTGSGKSTLAMSLLRFAEPASGSIWLDGVDITSIGVDDLRSRITYIPQDAVLFSGTVRDNLDPFSEHSDDDLLDALARVNLGPRDTPEASRAPSRVPSKPLLTIEDGEAEDSRPTSALGGGGKKVVITLTTEVSAGGSNFSQGQRQLVAMARALLRRSNLIIMDEATASVDFATDEAIQQAIRTEFKSSTLLTIAHRLSSVIDYDRLLVLSDGGVAEFDTPANLLRKEGGLFKALAEKSGKFRDLVKAAEKKEGEKV